MRLQVLRRVFVPLLVAAAVAPCATSAAAPGAAGDVATRDRARACSAIAERVDAVAGTAPLLLRSYDETGAGAPTEPALATAAFTYDNALATIALVACGRITAATRIGHALLGATHTPRVRNAYRAGVIEDPPVANGWWDADAKAWAQDPYQMGSATGNVAWTALALLTLHRATGDRAWLDAAVRAATWVVDTTADSRGVPGYTGGVVGFDDAPTPQTWKSTEHHIDLVAVFARLARLQPGRGWQRHEATARHFVQSQWDDAGRFRVGTGPDGVTVNTSLFALDTQLWPSLLPEAPAPWVRAARFAMEHFAVPGGVDFNDDRDGLWVEGTAQAALTERAQHHDAVAARLLEEVERQFAPGGFAYATREQKISTGLSNLPGSAAADVFYFHRPHLGATAWIALAATGWNPFSGGLIPATRSP